MNQTHEPTTALVDVEFHRSKGFLLHQMTPQWAPLGPDLCRHLWLPAVLKKW